LSRQTPGGQTRAASRDTEADLQGSRPMAATTRTVAYVGNAESHDVDVMAFDAGTLSRIDKVRLPGEPGSATPMAVSPDRRFLYVGIRSKPYTVACYAIDAASGRLTHLGNGPLADSMAYHAVDAGGRFLLSASYPGHKIAVNAIDAHGVVGETLQVIGDLHYAHAIRTDPAGRFAFAASLGSDTVRQYRFDAATGRLTANTPDVLRFGDKVGPRHFVFHPDGRHAYLLSELSVEVYALDYAAEAGTLTIQQAVSYKTPGYAYNGGTWAGADIRLTPNGAFVYACERTTSTITAFRIAPDGTMTLVEQVPTETQPRTIAVDPSGRHLLAAGQLSHHVMVYAIDQEAGRLTILARYSVGRNPNWIEVVTLP
jgi:6-phosphogluconolactonase